jgi:hypothetical protein
VPADRITCVSGGERIALADGVIVTVVPSLHSCIWTGSLLVPTSEVCLGDLGVLHAEREERMRAFGAGLATSLDEAALEHMLGAAESHSPRGDGGALVFLIETPEGSVLYQDTSGRWGSLLADLRPDVAILAAAGRGNVDGEPVQGSLAGFVAEEAQLLQVDRVVLGHHDDWLPGFSGAADVGSIRDALAALDPPVQLIELDYLDATPLF